MFYCVTQTTFNHEQRLHFLAVKVVLLFVQLGSLQNCDRSCTKKFSSYGSTYPSTDKSHNFPVPRYCPLWEGDEGKKEEGYLSGQTLQIRTLWIASILCIFVTFLLTILFILDQPFSSANKVHLERLIVCDRYG